MRRRREDLLDDGVRDSHAPDAISIGRVAASGVT
jgi:hypothetical protein